MSKVLLSSCFLLRRFSTDIKRLNTTEVLSLSEVKASIRSYGNF